jgi:hypothetical protein
MIRRLFNNFLVKILMLFVIVKLFGCYEVYFRLLVMLIFVMSFLLSLYCLRRKSRARSTNKNKKFDEMAFFADE